MRCYQYLSYAYPGGLISISVIYAVLSVSQLCIPRRFNQYLSYAYPGGVISISVSAYPGGLISTSVMHTMAVLSISQ